MIGRPRHLADDGLSETGADPRLRVDGLDLEAVTTNVSRLGGDAQRFARRLASAQAAGAEGSDLLRGAVALAAWRSGVLALRDEALGRLREVARHGEGRGVAGAALELDPDDIEEFAARQVDDCFWWPGRQRWNGYVCAVGGFAGLGGAWIEPPRDGRVLRAVGARPSGGPPVAASTTSDPAAFAVRTGDTWWRVDADVWGSRLTKTGDTPAPSAAVHTSRVSLVTRVDSYLAWVHVRDVA
ncbi:potassium transporter Kef [Microbacterium sp. P07]|uniref:potassium transporter Kef n=1 Tax=Microbacterium sp. P07 TaxID=3366952 RepID=UPI003744F176